MFYDHTHHLRIKRAILVNEEDEWDVKDCVVVVVWANF